MNSSSNSPKDSNTHRASQDAQLVWRVYVGGIPSITHPKDLQNYFSNFGPVKRIKTFRDSTPRGRQVERRLRGFCVVETYSEETYRAILEYKHHRFQGRRLLCDVVRAGKELEEFNERINRRRGLVKNVPSNLAVSALEKLLAEHAGAVDKLFPLHSGKEASKSSRKSYQTYSVLFEDELRFRQFLAIGHIFLDGSPQPILLLPFTHFQKLTDKRPLPKPKACGGQTKETCDDTPSTRLRTMDSPLFVTIQPRRISILDFSAHETGWSARPTQREYHSYRDKTVQATQSNNNQQTFSNYMFRLCIGTARDSRA